MVINKAMEQNSNHVVNPVNLNNNNTNNEEKNVNRDFNPSVLGREFVRQYYTMLNEGPQNLFRFYNNNSSLIHGNEQQQAAFGQQDINKRLMSLNFKDCHTKIRQVDSLETGSKSVVVQVIGELSNNGQPMRRFFQTFILAPKTPTHYYVRNDIFRYQDEVFLDDDEGYTEDNMDDQLVENTTDSTDNSSVLNSSLVVNNQQKKIEKLNGQLSDQEKLNNDLDRNKFADISPINLVGSSTNELNHSGSEQSLDSKQSSLFNDKPKDLDNEEQEKQQDNETNETTNELITTTNQLNSAPTPVLVQPPAPPQNEPRTYATMVQRNFGHLSTTTNLDKNDNLVLNNNITNLNKKDDYMSNEWQFESKTNNDQPNETKSTTTASTDKEKRSNGRDYSDEQQVFVGNLPQVIEENQLKEFFIKYGQILDIRICQKQGKTPNYGFITFSESEVVKKILSQKPIFFNGHRINVEEKRSGANKFNSNSGNFGSRNSTNVNSSNNSNRNFGSSGTSSQNQFSAFNSRNRDQDRRNFNNKERKTTLNSLNSTSNNRTQNSNFNSRR